MVEQLEAVSLNERIIHIRELLDDNLLEIFSNEFLVGLQLVCISFLIFDRCLDQVFVSQLDHLLEDLALKFESGKMAAVGHDKQDLFRNFAIEIDVEFCADIRIGADVIIHVPHRFETDLHQLWFLMIDGKDDRLKNSLEGVRVKLEQSISAESDDILDQFEEALSEFWIQNVIMHDHLQGWLAQIDQNWIQHIL